MAKPVVIDHIPAALERFVGSPSITILDDGTYLASHDEFGPQSSKNHTSIFSSSDHGRTWTKTSDIDGQFWSSLFSFQGSVYLLGTDKEFGDITIRRSSDRGHTWTSPHSPSCGLLITGSFHCAPTPLVHHAGRIWRAFEDIGGPGDWPTHFRCFVLSAPENVDILDATKWTRTNIIGGNEAWLNGSFHGWLEGNAVVNPDGNLVDILRVDAKPLGDVTAIVRISEDGRSATFDPNKDFVAMPGGSVKFTIRWDSTTKRYWALTNAIPDGVNALNPGIERNTLVLISSSDARDWEVEAVLWHRNDAKHYGCQYVDWQFDGADIIAVARTADDDDGGGAKDFHDANYLTFMRVCNFRSDALDDRSERRLTFHNRPSWSK